MRRHLQAFSFAPLLFLAAAVLSPAPAVAQDVTVPDVTRMGDLEAQAALAAAGFVVERMGTTVPTPNAESESTVQGQLPAAGQVRPWGSKVQIFIYGRIQVTVPDVTGLPREFAEAAIRGAGLHPAPDLTDDRPPTRAREFTVNTQSPVGGHKVDRNSNVVIVVYGGFENTIPDVRKLSYESAVAALEKAGLKVGGIERGGPPAPTEELANRVASQTPAQGSRIPADPAKRVVSLVLYGPGKGGEQPKTKDDEGKGGLGGGLLGLSTLLFEGTATASDGSVQNVKIRVTYSPDGTAEVTEMTTGARWKKVPGSASKLVGSRGRSLHFPDTLDFALDATINGDTMTGELSGDDATNPPAQFRWTLSLRRRS